MRVETSEETIESASAHLFDATSDRIVVLSTVACSSRRMAASASVARACSISRVGSASRSCAESNRGGRRLAVIGVLLTVSLARFGLTTAET
jgi:hypothetical protein